MKINREFMVFFVFLLVSIVFWFVQTFKESTTARINYKIELTGIPSNIILTSDVPKKVEVAVSGRGFTIIDYLTKSDARTLQVDYSQFEKADGMLVLNNNTWKKIVTNTVNTVRDTTSWITLSCMSENGPPLPSKPMRLAGTWHEYSGSASSHESRMMT